MDAYAVSTSETVCRNTFVDSSANCWNTGYIEKKYERPEDRDVPRERAECIEPCVCFPGRSEPDMESAVEIFYRKIRCDFFPEFRIAEIDGLESFKVINQHQHKHTALAQVTDAVIKNKNLRLHPHPIPLPLEGEGWGEGEAEDFCSL